MKKKNLLLFSGVAVVVIIISIVGIMLFIGNNGENNNNNNNGNENINNEQKPNENHKHEMYETVVSPTCISKGYTRHSCKNCNYYYDDSFIKETGHDVNYNFVKFATCSSEGYEEGKCKICNETFTKVLPKKEHMNLVAKTTKEKCNNKIVGCISCANCNEIVSVLGHTIVDGKCSICDTEYTEEQTENVLKLNKMENGNYEITGCSGEIKNLYITSGNDDFKITKISDNAFSDCYYLSSMEIEEGIEVIGNGAFNNYSTFDHSNISIPNSLKFIGHKVFWMTGSYEYENCYYLGNAENPYIVLCGVIDESKKDYIINENTKIIASYAFSECENLTSIKIPDGVISISNCAFSSNINLTNVELPETLESIDSRAFYECDNLTQITIPSSIKYLGLNAFAISFFGYRPSFDLYYNGTLREWIELDKYKTSAGIKNGTFTDVKHFYVLDSNNSYYEICDKLVIPSDVEKINSNSFSNLRTIKNVVLHDKIKEIGDGAFSSCTELTDVEFNDGLTIIGEYAFEYCIELKNAIIPNSVKEIGSHAFFDCCALSNVKLSENIEDIKEYTFAGCNSLEEIIIPENVKSIGTGAFKVCSSFTDVIIPDSVTKISEYAFAHCYNLKSITLPKGIKKIDNYTFTRCDSLLDIEIPDSVTEIGHYAFEDCDSLTNITLPNSIVYIGQYAFEDCSYLNSVIILSKKLSIGKFAFYDCRELKKIYNLSELQFTIGSEDYGYIAYYADEILTYVPDSE